MSVIAMGIIISIDIFIPNLVSLIFSIIITKLTHFVGITNLVSIYKELFVYFTWKIRNSYFILLLIMQHISRHFTLIV